MNSPSSSSFPPSSCIDSPVSGCGCLRSVSWGAILAGVSAALALQVLFMMLGAGLGFAIYSPITNDNPVADLGTGAVIIQGVSAVLSLWFGGWIAGRFTRASCRTGWLHGFSVWCVATVAGVLFVSFGAGWALGDLSKLVGGGLSMAGQPAAALVGGASDPAKDALKQSGDTLTSFGDEALGRRPADSNSGTTVRAKREISTAVVRLFNPVVPSDREADRAALIQVLVQHADLNQAEATQVVADWTSAYERLKADLATAKQAAETKARELAEKAATALAVMSFCAFFGFALGAVAASCGGNHGAACARRCEIRSGSRVA
ncbi:MAG: hypothetical protein H7Y06_00540 [Opitutaceae bacterium]|nr:hypothetical protein [Opitutaceae bacterium]